LFGFTQGCRGLGSWGPLVGGSEKKKEKERGREKERERKNKWKKEREGETVVMRMENMFASKQGGKLKMKTQA
jgi:predicted sugar kinase